jgi:hypothetical protein
MFSVDVRNGAPRFSLIIKRKSNAIASLSFLSRSAGLQPTAPPETWHLVLYHNGGKIEIWRK